MSAVENSLIDGSMDVDQPNPSENLNENSAKDPTDMDTNDTNNDVNENTGSALRRQSLLLAAFPWFSSIIMTPKKLSEELGINHYAYRFVRSMDEFETFLEDQTLHVSPLKALMREVDVDVMEGLTSNAISSRECSILRPVERASNFCSLITAYRLLDVISMLEQGQNSVRPPLQHRQKFDIPKNTKFLHYFKDWTSTLQKFRRNFFTREKNILPIDYTSDIRKKQLQALFQLHANMGVDKGLFNLQLAAAQISFMLQYSSETISIPDFPNSLQAFKDIVLSNSSTSNTEEDDSLISFLEHISRDQIIDQLRLPLQVALLISPIFLLQDVQIHLLQIQRYRLALYSKTLGNDRPDDIANVERVIWEELFKVAKGSKTVEDAAKSILETIPPAFDEIDDAIRSWFFLDLPNNNNNPIIHLSSNLIEITTIPENWPLASALEVGGSPKSGLSTGSNLRLRERTPDDNAAGEELENQATPPTNILPNHDIEDEHRFGRGLRNRSSKRSASSSHHSTLPNNDRRKKARKSAPKSKALSIPVGLDRRKKSSSLQQLPFIVGNTYLQIEDIDINELMAPKSKSIKDPLPLLERPNSNHKFSFDTRNVYGDISGHTMELPSDARYNAIKAFVEEVDNLLNIKGRTPYIENSENSGIFVMNSSKVQTMDSRTFQENLRGHHIVVTDVNLSQIPCNRRGFLTLNGLKEIVDMEDQSSSGIPTIGKRTVKEFIENLTSPNKNILSTFRMKSYSGIESSHFSSDHAAWRETLSEPYCDQDDIAQQSSLRWTQASTANTTQFWRLAPSGFGIFFDIRSGSRWVIIATQDYREGGIDVERWDKYLGDFHQMKPKFDDNTDLKAIRLEPGHRLILRPNTLFAVITLQDSITTGGFYLATHTFYDSLYGRIHTFAIPSEISEGEEPSLSTFTRRIVQYIHNAFVLEDPGDGDHLPNLGTMDGVRDLFALFTITMFLNVFDDRTYRQPEISANQPKHSLATLQVNFDINAIPVTERLHFCYTRGLVFDLLFWFFNRYSISNCNDPDKEINTYRDLLIPFLVHIGRHIMGYKRTAYSKGYPTYISPDQVEEQVRSVLFCRPEIKKEYQKQISAHHEVDDPSYKYDMGFDFTDLTINERQLPISNRIPIIDFLTEGQTLGDQRFFKGLSCQFVLDELESQDDSENQSSAD